MVSSPASHLGGLWLKSQSRDWLSWLHFLFLLSPSRQILVACSTLNQTTVASAHIPIHYSLIIIGSHHVMLYRRFIITCNKQKDLVLLKSRCERDLTFLVKSQMADVSFSDSMKLIIQNTCEYSCIERNICYYTVYCKEWRQSMFSLTYIICGC